MYSSSSSALVTETVETVEYPPEVADVISVALEAVSHIPGARVHAFGSTVNGFGDGYSDIDLVLEATKQALVQSLRLASNVSNKDLPKATLAALQQRLRTVGFRILERVLHAKVPVLKMVLGTTECDLSCNNLLPIFNTKLLKAYANLNQRVVSIVQHTKQWAKKNEVHGAPDGHLSSYAFTLLVIFYMQVRGALPCLQALAEDDPMYYQEGESKYNIAMEEFMPIPKPSVQVSFRDFTRFFCHEFKWGTWVVSVRTGKCRHWKQYPDLKSNVRDGISTSELNEMVHIEDPFQTSRNLNCVLGPGSNAKLWFALLQVAGPAPDLPDERPAPEPTEPEGQKVGTRRWTRGTRWWLNSEGK